MEVITIQSTIKEEQYKELIPQVLSLLETESDVVANMSNIAASLKQTFSYYSWVGFYLLKNNELVLGPFQGKVACSRIQIGKGVCGTAVKKKKRSSFLMLNNFPDIFTATVIQNRKLSYQ